MLPATLIPGADVPEASISNGQIRVKMYLPDPAAGFYKGARFDWIGIISSLEFAGHNYYGPWFTKIDPSVGDFTYRDDDIVVGLASSAMGPAEEFQTPLGFDTAKTGERFIKIGVGILKKPDETRYAFSKPYEILSNGKWSVKKSADSVEFTQELADADLGYGYVYTKTIRLTPDKPEMVIEHTLKNTGKLPIKSVLYDHNFLSLDKLATGDITIKTPWEIKPARPPDPKFLQVSGFGTGASDYDFRIEDRKAGAGVRIQGDHPLQNASLWSIRSVMAVEPFIEVNADPGKDFSWKYTYTYCALPR